MVALVTVVLGQGRTGVDAGLTCRYRHVRGVGDENGPLHQAGTGPGILESWELGQDIGHLIAPLTAADVDDDIGIAPLGDGVLCHGLAGPEASGDSHRPPPLPEGRGYRSHAVR